MLSFCSSVLSKILSPFLTSVTASNSERSLHYCKLLQEGCIYRHILKISRKMSSMHVANSKKVKMYGKFTMFLDIYGQFAVSHEGECFNSYSKITE